MKTTPRKILSLFLSFLMVFGALATALPTTVFAAETNTVTLLGVDGVSEIASNAYSVGSVLDLVKIAGLDYKNAEGKFLTFVDGEGNVYGADYTVSQDATLTATYQTVNGFFSGADIANLASSEIYLSNLTRSAETKADGITYARLSASANNSNVCALYLPATAVFEATDTAVTVLDMATNYNYITSSRVVMQYLPNDHSQDTRKGLQEFTSEFTTLGDDGLYHLNKSFPQTKYISEGYSTIKGYRFGPWGYQGIGTTDYYADIKYVGSFANQEIADAFDFDKYMGIVVEEDDAPVIVIKGETGNTIGTLTKEVGDNVDLLEESGLDYKNEDGKFLTFVDGEGNVLGTTYTMTSDSITLTATYQNVYGFFSGADLAALPSSRFNTASFSYAASPDNEGYFRITSATSGSADGLGIFLTEDEKFVTVPSNGVTVIDAISDYVTASPKITLQLLSLANDASSNSRQTVSYHQSGYYTADNGIYYINDLIFPHTSYTKSTTVYGYRIGPWGFNTTGSTAHYFDINYIASFENADIAALFDFDKYMGTEGGEGGEGGDDPILPPETPVEGVVELKNTDGSTIKTLEPEVGDVLDLLEESGLDYVDEDGKFLSFVDTNGMVYGTSYTVSEGAILTATYQSIYGYYSASDIASLPAGQTKLTNFTGSTVERNGETYYRLSQTANNTNVLAIYFPAGYTFKPSADSVTVIDASTDFQNIGRTFLQYYYAFQDDSAKTNTTCEYTSNIVKLGDDGRYHLVNPFTFTNFLAQNKTDVYGYRFAPYGGWGTTDAKYTFDIKYIATFDSEDIAKSFDFDKYNSIMLQSKTFDLTFKDASGKELIIEDAPYGSYITPEIIKSNKPYGFITQYFEGDKLYVLSDWKSGDSSLGLTFKVSGTTDFTAVYTEAKIYSAAALNDEAITVGVTSGTNYGKRLYSDEYRHEYLRMYDNTTGTAHQAFKLDWDFSDSFSVDTNVFGAAAILSTTNAAQAENAANNTPRQSLKPFTGKASADQGGQTSVPFLYASLKDGNVWTGLSTFALPSGITMKGVRFMPFGAQALASTDPGYGTAVYSDIEFIGFFANTDAADMFDFRAYKNVIDKETKFLVGDASGDGVVNTLDAVILARYLANWVGYDNRIYDFNCDINEDGFVTPIDLVVLIRRLANWTTETPMDSERYYNPSAQPDARGGTNSYANYATMTSDDIIEDLYEPLRAAHPENITRENIGKDDSGTYDMWCYIFEPEDYEYTVFISAGSHGMNEAQSYLGLARLMQLVWDDDQFDEELKVLREKVRFITIPVVNVWDVSERVKGTGTTYSPYNSNSVNINRNWLTENPEQEVANIRAILNRYKDEIDFGYDFHTDPEGVPGYGTYLLVYPYGVYDFFSDRLKEVCAYLDYKNFDSKGINIKDAFRGDNLNYPASSSYDVNLQPDYPRTQNISTCASVMWTEFGFPGATIEHGSRKFGDRVFCSSDDMTAAVELYANQILQQLNYDFHEKVAISKSKGN